MLVVGELDVATEGLRDPCMVGTNVEGTPLSTEVGVVVGPFEAMTDGCMDSWTVGPSEAMTVGGLDATRVGSSESTTVGILDSKIEGA